MKGIKTDLDKREYSLLPWAAVGLTVDVLAWALRKYPRDNWTLVRPVRRYADAAARHLEAIMRGEINDPESGLPHAAHLACNALFICWFVSEGVWPADRAALMREDVES